MTSHTAPNEASTRREDLPLVTGRARYTDDFSPAGVTYAAVLRSRYAHARIAGIDTSEAESRDGVLAVLTAADIRRSSAPGAIQVAGKLPVDQHLPTIPMLAADVVRYAGEPLALVIATDRYRASDAVSRIDVEYERLEAITTPREALRDAAPLVHDTLGTNCAFDWRFGDHEALERVFDEADHTVSLDLVNQRVLPDPLEPRAVLADYDRTTGGCTVRMSTQAPHQLGTQLATVLGIEEAATRVIAPAVGGGFGSKTSPVEQTEPLIVWGATQVERPVKWAATRSESHHADHPGRDVHSHAELAVDEDGTLRGLRVDAEFNLGAYVVWGRTPAFHFHHMLSGGYDIPVIAGRLVGAFTHTTPIGPYRGAGRPEAIFTVERLLNRAAAVVGLDPAAVRRQSFIPEDEFPFETAVGAVYDSGDYERALDQALERVEYESVRDRQRALRQDDRYLGIGLSCGVENIGTLRPETARIEIDASGTVTASCGTVDTGQGHQTTFAALLADQLGVSASQIEVREGDSAALPSGVGTFASRSTPVGASALVQSASEVIERGRRLAAEHLDVEAKTVSFVDGRFDAEGGRSLSLREVAAFARGADDADSLVATTQYHPVNYAYPFGIHVAVVEVSPSTGEIQFHRYVTVDDCGVQLNPTLVEGQIHGGVAQGIGQALFENVVYDANGTLASATLQEYALPKATDVPEIEVGETVTPCPHTPTGAKGVGESGATVAPPAVVNAVVDALSPLGVTNIEMPLTAETVWRAVQRARGE